MDQTANYYSVLGVAKSASDTELRQAYEVQLQSLRAKTQADAPTPEQTRAAQRKALLDTALQTLLNPEKRRLHDEKLDWFVARNRLESERSLQASIRLKQVQEETQQRERDALAAAKEAAKEAARQAQEAEKHEAERARVEAGAAERFRQLREERLPFMDTQPPQLQDEEHTDVLPEPPPVPPANPEDAAHYLQSLAKKIAMGVAALVVFFALAYWLLKKDAPPTARMLPSAVATVPAAAASDQLPQASNPQADTATESNAAPGGAAQASADSPASPAVAPAKPTAAERVKAAELQQYQNVLRRVEREHPELNPGHPRHRDDWIAFVATRVKVHQKAGYPRSKALEIAVRDLETREQTQRMLDKQRSMTPPSPETAPKLDPGQHQGFDPKCRWVTPEQWSCK